MRADAQRNRERLLDAAVDLVLERGGEATRDAIAERAGVGIGTVYRHFPDRQSLLQAIVVHALDRSLAAGHTALATGTSGHDVLRQYMHAAVEHGLGVLNILHPLIDDANWPERRAAAETLLRAVVERARNDGALDARVTAQEIAFAIIRFGRPLAIGLPAEHERAIAHQHVDTYLDGLARQGARRPDGE